MLIRVLLLLIEKGLDEMSLFENRRESIKVNMSGTEYIKYKQRKKLTSNQKEASVIFGLCFVGIVIIAFLISDITYESPEPVQYFSGWYSSVSSLSGSEWNDIGKFNLPLFRTINSYLCMLSLVAAWVWIFNS